MRIKSILASMLVIAALASCSDNNDDPTPPVGGDIQTAYLSLQITYPTSMTRASTEQPPVVTGEESEINSLYVVTFDENKNLIHHAKENPVIVLSSSDFTSNTTNLANPIRVSPSTKYLLVVANPGALLKSRLTTLATGTSYATFNNVISVAYTDGNAEDRDDLANEIRTIDAGTAKNFAMINAGFYNTTEKKWEADCLLDVSNNLETEESASTTNRASLMIERLSAKMVVTVGSNPTILPTATGAKFAFKNWVLDYRNSKFFPFATKDTTLALHAIGGQYGNNFYTKDPNYSATDYMTGIVRNELVNRKPNVNWKNAAAVDYCIENTMEESEQRYGGATRVVIKATYVPVAAYDLDKDWFSFGSETYGSFADLQAAYTAAKTSDPTSGLITACDNFLDTLKVAKPALNSIADFSALQAGDISDITDGGELTKKENCIRWYKDGINYYYYEIRHDNTPNMGDMAFGKYGVVRNNWYALQLTKVNGKGTPWYPGGGPGEPEPGDPIDEEEAYLSFNITVGPWIYWTTDFEI